MAWCACNATFGVVCLWGSGSHEVPGSEVVPVGAGSEELTMETWWSGPGWAELAYEVLTALAVVLSLLGAVVPYTLGM